MPDRIELDFIKDKYEIDVLFSKLNTIAKLFNSYITVKQIHGFDFYSQCQHNLIGLGYKSIEKNIYELKRDKEDIIKNIDSFKNEEHKKMFKECPLILTIMLHEIGHLLTIDSKNRDLKKYKKDEKSVFYFGRSYESEAEYRRLYRNLPFEKVADTLSSEFYYYNYDNIVKILLGEDVEITKDIVENNLKIAKKIKNKYIKYV